MAEAAELSGDFKVVGFLDDSLSVGEEIWGVPILGAVNSMANHRTIFDQVIVAIGNNVVRELRMQQLADAGFNFAKVIHPRAFVSHSAVLGSGSAVMAGAVVGTEAQVGMGVIVNCGVVVDHHAIVEDFGHLGVNASMAGGTSLGRGAWMQAGSALGYGVKIAPKSILAPGEAVDAKADRSKNG